MNRVLRFAHLSDWHATTLAGAGPSVLRGKRLSGWASWALSRRRHHSPMILDAAMRDVEEQGVDGVLVTGDLTHVSLPSEFAAAASQLARLGRPDRVFLIPGNHDCYVPVEPAEGWDRWAPYLRGEAVETLDAELAACLASPPDSMASPAALAADRTGASALAAPRHADYPTLRRVGGVALVGLCSAIPTPIFRAGGELGEVQRARLRALLARLAERGFFRIVMIHHPIHPHGEPERRALWDGAALRELLAEVGAELVLHGHKHRRRVHFVDGPAGPIPAIGVPSSSEVGSRPDRLAQYHVYSIHWPDGERARPGLEVAVRGFDPASGRFVALPDRLV